MGVIIGFFVSEVGSVWFVGVEGGALLVVFVWVRKGGTCSLGVRMGVFNAGLDGDGLD